MGQIWQIGDASPGNQPGNIAGESAHRRRLSDFSPVELDSSHRRPDAHAGNFHGGRLEFGFGVGNFTGMPPEIWRNEWGFPRGSPIESQDRRRLAARFPGIFPASRLPGSQLGNLGGLPGNWPAARAKSPVSIFPPRAADQIIRPK